MYMKRKEFLEMLEQNPELKADLFIRGFVISDRKISGTDQFPMYGTWREEIHAGFYFYGHPLTGMHFYEDQEGRTFFLMGHAYDPFTMEIQEEKILEHIAAACGTDEYMDRVNEITGVFVFGCAKDGRMDYLVDPSGMQSACSGLVNGTFYLTSHPQLVGDIEHLRIDSFVKELVAYKWYGRVMGPYLPADLTPFASLKRIVPDMLYTYDDTISHRRFWPLTEAQEVKNEEEYNQVVRDAADILKNNMALIAEKWEHPWISLTGGIDSNTTFAAANGNYDKFEAFSYISAEKEIRDAEAAKKIAEHFDVPHHVYAIPDDDAEIEKFDEIYEVLMHNDGYVAPLKHNEARKRMVLRKQAECDVEVKSWVSETIRAYWYKHYGRKSMPALSPKLYRNLYKIFIGNRILAHKVDRLFADYIRDFEYESIPEGYPTADMHYNEVTWGSWGGLNISEMKYCFDITFIYNNRRFFDLMFRVPLEKRISDQHHLDMKKYLNQELFDMNIRVVNMKETDFRAAALNVIFTANMVMPF